MAANPGPYPCRGGGLLAVAVKQTLPLQGGGPLATGGASYIYIYIYMGQGSGFMDPPPRKAWSPPPLPRTNRFLQAATTKPLDS